MENSHPANAFDIKFPSDPLDCDAGRELTATMLAERAIVAGLLHHLMQYGIGARDIPDCADPGSTPERCVMEGLFQRGAGAVELVVEDDMWRLRNSAEAPSTGKVLLELGAGVNVVEGWSSAHRTFPKFEKAMQDFAPCDFYDANELLAAGAGTAAQVGPVVRVDAEPQHAGVRGLSLQGLIQALNESASTEGCPAGQTLVDSAALLSLVQAVGLGSSPTEPAAAPDTAANADAPTPEPEQLSPRMRKLLALQEKIAALRDSPPMEHVAVRHPCGGFIMVTRPVAGK